MLRAGKMGDGKAETDREKGKGMNISGKEKLEMCWDKEWVELRKKCEKKEMKLN